MRKYVVQLAVMAVVVVCIIVFGKADAMDMFLSDVIIVGLFFSLFTGKYQPVKFTLSGDMMIAGAAFMIPFLTRTQHLLQIVLVLLIPITDVFMYAWYRRKEAGGGSFFRGRKSSVLIGVFLVLAFIIPVSVAFVNFSLTYDVALRTVFLVASAVCFFFCGRFMLSDSLLNAKGREKYIPYSFWAIPIALAVWFNGENVPTYVIVASIALAVVLCVILKADNNDKCVQKEHS